MKHFLRSMAALLLILCGNDTGGETPKSKPNIVYSLCDDLGYRTAEKSKHRISIGWRRRA